MMQDFEKLGVFYLGKEFDPVKKKVEDDHLVLLESKDLTTHAVCLGMTGSGKTGLGITILEEAALDKIPAIIIDPKGDLSNLLLTFPHLSPSEFEPWVDPSEAKQQGMDLSAYASSVASTWKEGLERWGEGAARIQRLKESVEMVIYTPASQAGIPLSILSSFAAPSKETLLDSGALRDRILSLTSSLLGLIGIEADPIKSREHILISAIVDQAWREGQNLDLATLIQRVQRPPFEKIGALNTDTFFPAKDRMALSVSLNSLLASPGFQAWMEGDPLDVKTLLNTPEGKPKLSIISIAHLSDSERMFFVTLLLNEVLAWMRRQPGSPSLRALLYMDEIFGYFPPTSMPPSKLPMLTLLKQARAFGLGVILATQNPVDLDYKGLANCGIWFIGKLQTERDRARVIEGLNTASNGELDAKSLDKWLAATGKRIFIMRSIYRSEPILFETRWTMSYLRGPLTLTQIAALTDQTKRATPAGLIAAEGKPSAGNEKPVIPISIEEVFVHRPNVLKPSRYKPLIGGFAKLHFVDSQRKIDTWKEVCLVAPLSEDEKKVEWDQGENVPDIKKWFQKEPAGAAAFEELPASLMEEKNYPLFAKSLATALYQNQSLPFYSYPELKMTSNGDESEADFRSRVALTMRERRDEIVNKIKEKYAQKIDALADKMRRAQTKATQQQQQAGIQKAETYISIGTTILGAILGKKVTKGTISQAGTSMRRAGRMSKESQEAAQAEEDYNSLNQQQIELRNKLDQEISQVPLNVDPATLKIETENIKPRKSDISVDKPILIWWPLP